MSENQSIDPGAPVFPRKLYREDGGEFLVEVIKTELDESGMNVTFLRCVCTLRPSPLFGAIAPGEEFDVSVRPGYKAYCGWHLSDLAPAESGAS